jgi:hypothetical protein
MKKVNSCKPPGGIQLVVGPSVWMGMEMEADESWLHIFTLEQLEEIDLMLRKVEHEAAPLYEINRLDYPLTTLQSTFDSIEADLERGRGFALMRGLPLRRYTLAQTQIIYWILGLNLGRAVSQNGLGELMGHVKVVDSVLEDPVKRGYMKPHHAPFHTDTCDIVGLMCLRKAKKGGESRIASAMTVHNILLNERLDLLEVLYEPFFLDIKDEQQLGKAPYYQLPVFSWKDDQVSTRYSRSRVNTGQRHEAVPRLTDKQVEAMNYLETVLERPGVTLPMDFQVGDIQWLNNYTIYHSRNAYIDYSAPSERRHLLRLWLAGYSARSLPLSFLDVYNGDLTQGLRGGIPRLVKK